MKIKLAGLFALLGWFAVITQFVLMMENRTTSLLEMGIRFFSYFTILTNILVAIYFTTLLWRPAQTLSWVHRPGTLTAITLYILIVGLVYQVILRYTWSPTGMQQVVDELLHTVIPLLVLVFWFLYENKKAVRYQQLPAWLIYPFLYLLFILIRGSQSGFYPYPFIDINQLGWSTAMLNAAALVGIFLVMGLLFIFTGRKIAAKNISSH